MKAIRFFLAITWAAVCMSILSEWTFAQDTRPVLVELFTSAGCSNCPPAEKSLEFLKSQQPIGGADVITLAFHVDYYDTTLWSDPLASPMFTRRQELYGKQFRLDSIFTPQVIIQGKTPVAGVDMNRTISAIHDAIKLPAGKIDAFIDSGRLKINASGLPAHQGATLYVAIVEDGAPAKSFSGGERSGDSVVRELSGVGIVAENQSELSIETQIPLRPEWKNSYYVIFVQNNFNRRVLAVTKLITSDGRKG